MEKWDAYDTDFKIVPGRSLLRGEAIPEGLFHLVCDVLVRHTDGSYLLMQRDWRKAYGGMWEATAGGSALQGESALECAVRELRDPALVLFLRGEGFFLCRCSGFFLRDGSRLLFLGFPDGFFL